MRPFCRKTLEDVRHADDHERAGHQRGIADRHGQPLRHRAHRARFVDEHEVRRVRGAREVAREVRQADADEDHLAVAQLARGDGGHHLLRGVRALSSRSSPRRRRSASASRRLRSLRIEPTRLPVAQVLRRGRRTPQHPLVELARASAAASRRDRLPRRRRSRCRGRSSPARSSGARPRARRPRRPRSCPGMSVRLGSARTTTRVDQLLDDDDHPLAPRTPPPSARRAGPRSARCRRASARCAWMIVDVGIAAPARWRAPRRCTGTSTLRIWRVRPRGRSVPM